MRIFEKVFTISLALLKSKAGKKLVAAWGISMLLFSASPAQAAEWRVSDYEEFKLALQYTVKNGDTIILEDNIVFDANSTALVLPAGITEITIKSVGGYMCEIKGKADRLLMTENKTNVTLILENVTFTGGSLTGEDNNGGAILSGGNLIIKGTEENPVVFSQNLSESSGGAISADGTVTIESGSNQFTANVANGGGAVHSQGNMVITGGTNMFDTNFGLLVGGAIVTGAISEDALADMLKVDENGKLTYSVPSQFQTGGNGPKVILSGGENWFAGNFAAYAGGAIFSDVDISGGKNYFHENYAALAGGAIVGGKINITGGTNEFIGNGKTPDPNEFDDTAAGGAIFAFDNMVITGGKNTFEENVSYQQGGAIAAPKFIILDGKNTFNNNESWLGGAIYAGREGDDGLIGGYVAISGGTNVFEGNTGSAIYAANGDEEGDIGLVAISGGTNSFIENINENNVQGGAIHSEGDVMISGGDINTFADNAAIGDAAKGGAVYAGEDVIISGGVNVFTGNWVESDVTAEGGAIFSHRDVIITGGENTFEDNWAVATNIDGAVAPEALPLAPGPVATAKGGAIYTDTSVILDGITIFKNNIALAAGDEDASGGTYGPVASGGAIYANEKVISEGVTTFEDNWAIGGQIAEGGAIYARDNVELLNSVNTFTGNWAVATGNGADVLPLYAAEGGAIFSHGDVIISKSQNTFTNNGAGATDRTDLTSTATGGAIYTPNSVKITAGSNNLFTDNYAMSNNYSYGGAIYASVDVTIKDSTNTFERNMAFVDSDEVADDVKSAGATIARGGAIFAFKNLELSGGANVFKNNYATGGDGGFGGAIAGAVAGVVEGENHIVTIRGGANGFEGNGAFGHHTASGGAVSSLTDIEISDGLNVFLSNWAEGGVAAGGGAIYAETNTAIRGSTIGFTGNSATGGERALGGAINAQKITLEDSFSHFANNWAEGGDYAYGGAIFAEEDMTISGGQNTFTGNEVNANYSEGGAIYAEGNVTISDGGDDDSVNRFEGNFAIGNNGYGGAVSAIGSVEITGGENYFQENIAFGAIEAAGGAICAEGDVIITDGENYFQENSAVSEVGAYGGAIAANLDVTISGGANYFMGNTAIADEEAAGGAIYAEGNVIITGGENYFQENSAVSEAGAYGGAIYAEGDVIINNGETIFYNNIADGAESKGGAIYAEGDVTFTGGSQVTFLSNDADDGSALYAEGTFTLEDGSTLTGEGEFAAAEFSLSDSCLTPSGEMIFKGNSGTPTTITLENMDLQGSYDGYLAAGDGDILKLDGEFNVDVNENVTIGLGGRVEADASSKLVKAGAGDLRIIGEQHYYNAEVSDGGFMLGQVDGEDGMLIGHLSVFDSGKLGGNGKIIGNVSVAEDGVISPGNSIGTIAIDGELSMNGATLEIEVDKNGGVDKIIVTNNSNDVVLKDSTIKITPLGSFVFGNSYEYLSVENGAIASDNNRLIIDNSLLNANFDTANMSSIVITRDPDALLNLAQTPNQKAMAVMAMTDTNDMVYLIFNNPNDAARLLNFTSGEIHASTQTSLTESTRHIREAVLSRMGNASNDGGIWAQVVGSWDNYDSNSTSKLESETRGIIAGYDKDNGSRRTGISLGVTKTENKINDLNSSSDVNSTHLALYTGSSDYSKSYQTRFGAGISWHSVDSNRTIPISNENLQAGYSARTYHLFGEIGKRQVRSKGYLEPFLGIAYASTNSGGFSERSNNAAGGALTVDGKTHSSTYSNLGVRLLSKASGDKMTLKASASWQHLLSGDTFKTSHRLLTGSTPFEIEGAPIAKDALVLDLGFDYHLSKNFSWGLSYNGQIAKQMHNNAIKLNFKWKY